MKLKYVERDLTLTFQEFNGLRRMLESILEEHADKQHKPPAYVESLMEKLKTL